MQGNEQAIADLLVRAALGDQFQDGQLTAAEAIGERRAALRRRRQALTQGLDGWRGDPHGQLLAQPFRMLLQHFLKRDRQAGGQAAQALAQLEGRLALAAILQQQGNQLALGKARLQLRTTLQGAAGHGSQACLGLGHAAFAALQ